MTVATPCSMNNHCTGWIGVATVAEGDPRDVVFPKGRERDFKVEDRVVYRRCTAHRHHADDWFADPGSGRDTPDGKARRRARDACWIDCPMKMRLLCLDEGMKPENLAHGIWGGYTEAQRQEIAQAIADRKRRRSGVDSTI